MALFNILYFTHWSAWADLLLTCKHKYSSPTGGNSVAFCNVTGAIGKVVFNGVKQGGLDVAWTLILCFWDVTHEWISSVFEVSVLFWIALLSSLSSWDKMILCVKLLVYDVLLAEENKTGLLSVVVDIFNLLYLKERPISLPVVPMGTIKQIYDKWDYVRKLKNSKIEKLQTVYFDECWIFYLPLST